MTTVCQIRRSVKFGLLSRDGEFMPGHPACERLKRGEAAGLATRLTESCAQLATATGISAHMSNRAQHVECRRTLGWAEQPDKDGPAVDAWIRHELSRAYEGVLRERIPPELLQLVSVAPTARVNGAPR